MMNDELNDEWCFVFIVIFVPFGGSHFNTTCFAALSEVGRWK
jgi:hypothetical protein